jgi:hypothetical protein
MVAGKSLSFISFVYLPYSMVLLPTLSFARYISFLIV